MRLKREQSKNKHTTELAIPMSGTLTLSGLRMRSVPLYLRFQYFEVEMTTPRLSTIDNVRFETQQLNFNKITRI